MAEFKVKFHDGKVYTINEGHFTSNHRFVLKAGEKCEVATHCNSNQCGAKDGKPVAETNGCWGIHLADTKDSRNKPNRSTKHSYDEQHKSYMDEIKTMLETPGMDFKSVTAYIGAAKPYCPKPSKVSKSVGSSAGLEFIEYAVWFIFLLLGFIFLLLGFYS